MLSFASRQIKNNKRGGKYVAHGNRICSQSETTSRVNEFENVWFGNKGKCVQTRLETEGKAKSCRL